MTSRNVQTALAGFEAFNKGDLDAAVADYAETVRMTDHARGLSVKSRDEAKAWLGEWIAFSSDGRVAVDGVIDAGDTIVCQVSFHGTNDGPLGALQPTGRRVSIEGVEILRFDSNGKVIADDTYFDQLSLLIQLGHAQEPPA